MALQASASISAQELKEIEIEKKFLKKVVKEVKKEEKIEPAIEKYVVPILDIIRLEDMAEKRIKRGEPLGAILKMANAKERGVIGLLERDYGKNGKAILNLFKGMLRVSEHLVMEEQYKNMLLRRGMAAT